MWCGRHTIQYDLFVLACRKLLNKDIDLGDDQKLLGDAFSVRITVEIQDLVLGSRKPQDVLDLVWKFHQSQCFDEKDRIGALYGFLSSSQRPLVNLADPYLRIYEQCAVELANKSSDRLLAHLTQFQPIYLTKGIRAPSWVPDWFRERQDSPFPTLVNRHLLLSTYLGKSVYEQLSRHQSVNYCEDQALWRDFISRERNDIIQCTRFSTYYDNDGTELEVQSSSFTGSAVFRIQWYHPITHRYGMPICTVVKVQSEPEGSRITVGLARDL